MARRIRNLALLLGLLAVTISVRGTIAQQDSPPDAPQPITRTGEVGPLKVTVTADRDQVEVPAPITLTLRVECDGGVNLQVPQFKDLLGPFLVGEAEEREPADCPELKVCREWVYALESVLPGTHQIPELTFAFSDPREKADGSTDVYEDRVTTDPIQVTIVQQLADVRAPVEVESPFPYTLLWWTLGVVGAMTAIALLVRYLRRRGALPGATRVEPPPPPHIWALAELDRLIAEDLVQRGMIQEFYYRINRLLRRYIELQFGLMAGEQTSEEFIAALQHDARLESEHKSLLNDFVRACDPVKYARQMPQQDEIEWVQTVTRQFIESTRPSAVTPIAPDTEARQQEPVA